MYKKYSLHRKIKNEVHHLSHGNKIVIGVLGTHKGIGVTHVSLMLAYYYSRWVGCETAYVSYTSNQGIEDLEHYYGAKKLKSSNYRGCFSLNHMTFFPNITESQSLDIFNDTFRCIILDFGSDYSMHHSEFLRCDQKIVLTCLSPWKIGGFLQFLEKIQFVKSAEQWMYLVPQEQELFRMRKEVGSAYKVYGVPYEPDPFDLKLTTIDFFNKIFM